MTLNINEVFGPTIQGEGRFTGRRAFFVRTSRCPLACSFCDTPYTWAFTENKAKKHREGIMYNQVLEEHQMASEEVVEKLQDLGLKLGDLVVLTGGEPLLQASEIQGLVNLLLSKGCLVQFETAGVLKPPHFDDDLRVFFSVSPKLENSGNPLRVRFSLRSSRSSTLVVRTSSSFAPLSKTSTKSTSFATPSALVLEAYGLCPRE